MDAHVTESAQNAVAGLGALSRWLSWRSRLAGSLALFALAGCSHGVLDPQGPIGAAEKTLLLNSLGIMLAVVVPTILATLGVAWWFRASNARARRRPGFTFSGQIELVVWAIPAMVVLLLGGIAWIGSHELDPARPIPSETEPVRVDVVSLDWKWLFIYPDEGVASVNRLVVPTGAPVAFRLTSGTVMNSFFVPQLGSQIYTMWGMATRLHLQADAPGVYEGFSAQISGEGFSDMRFTVDAMAPDGYRRWLAETRGEGDRLDGARYCELAAPSTNVAPVTFGFVEPDLFGLALRTIVRPLPEGADSLMSEGGVCWAN